MALVDPALNPISATSYLSASACHCLKSSAMHSAQLRPSLVPFRPSTVSALIYDRRVCPIVAQSCYHRRTGPSIILLGAFHQAKNPQTWGGGSSDQSPLDCPRHGATAGACM